MATQADRFTHLIEAARKNKNKLNQDVVQEIIMESKEDPFKTIKEEEIKRTKEEEAAQVAKERKEKLGNLKKNQRLLSEFTRGVLPTSGIDHVIDVYPPGTWASEALIPEIDESYVWDPDALETLILGKKLGHRVLFSGPPGTGKTSSTKQFAAILRQPHLQFNGKDGVEQGSLIGYLGLKNKNTVWVDGSIVQGCRMGAMVCIDEVMKIPAGVQMALQTLYETGGHLVLDDKEGTYENKLVKPDSKFFLVLTDNVKGSGDSLSRYAATAIQDTSFIDRIGLTYPMKYMSRTDEVNFLVNKFSMDQQPATKLVKFAGLIRNAFEKGEISLTLSLRGLSVICEMYNAGLPENICLDRGFISKLADDTEVAAVKQFWGTV